METKTVIEQPILTLKYDDCENHYKRLIYASELKALEVGAMLNTEPDSTSARSVKDESYEVVYKTEQGIALLHRIFTIGSYPDFERKEDVELVWIELH